jgi:uncharacterized protein
LYSEIAQHKNPNLTTPIASVHGVKVEFHPRNIRPIVLEALHENRVVCVVGARQVGKSTLVRDIATTDHPAVVRTLDDHATRGAANEDPTGFIRSLPRPAVIDEVQRAPDVLLAIKQLVDEEPAQRGQFLLTGSADVMTLPTVADALPGRVAYVTLWPLSQGELAGRREGFLSALFDGAPFPLADAPIGRQTYAERIAAGGFPEAHGRSPRGRTFFFDSYVSSLLARDLDEIADVRDHEAVGRLLRLLATRSGGLVDHAGLARDLGISDKTVKSYTATLERLFLVRRLDPWSANRGQREIRTPKVHVTDTGLLAYLLRANARSIGDQGELAGRFFETFVVCEVLRQASWASALMHAYHYRDKAQREVDLVLERQDGAVCGIEVKAAATATARDFRGLRYLRDRLGDRFRCGVVLYAGGSALPFGDRLWALPLEALWT